MTTTSDYKLTGCTMEQQTDGTWNLDAHFNVATIDAVMSVLGRMSGVAKPAVTQPTGNGATTQPPAAPPVVAVPEKVVQTKAAPVPAPKKAAPVPEVGKDSTYESPAVKAVLGRMSGAKAAPPPPPEEDEDSTSESDDEDDADLVAGAVKCAKPREVAAYLQEQGLAPAAIHAWMLAHGDVVPTLARITTELRAERYKTAMGLVGINL